MTEHRDERVAELEAENAELRDIIGFNPDDTKVSKKYSRKFVYNRIRYLRRMQMQQGERIREAKNALEAARQDADYYAAVAKQASARLQEVDPIQHGMLVESSSPLYAVDAGIRARHGRDADVAAFLRSAKASRERSAS